MKIIYVHHALRQKGNPPTQNDKIQPLGLKDAEVTAELMREISKSTSIKAIYTSPYYRCVKTAEILNKYLGVPVFEDNRFNEFNKSYDVFENGKVVTKTETWLDCQLRLRDAIWDIVKKYKENDTVICVTSGVNLTAFISLAYKIKPNENLPFPMVSSCSPVGFKIDKSCFDINIFDKQKA